MSITATPVESPDLDLPAYLTVAAARVMLSGLSRLPGLAGLDAESDADLAALLVGATQDIDAVAWAGRKVEADQLLAFPRFAPAANVDGGVVSYPSHLALTQVAWDWDDSTNEAVVPERVQLACLYQAAHLVDDAHAARREAIRSGLASQSVGSVSESYATPGGVPGAGLPASALGDRAARLMDKYRMRSGAML